jgi:ADP-heptose:LPS heptosyltransferase
MTFQMNTFFEKILEKIYSAVEPFLFSRQSARINKNTLLLLRLDSIGDYVLFRNYIAILKKSEKYKHFNITLCGNAWWKDLSEHLDHHFIDSFIWVDYDKMDHFKYRFGIYRIIHARGFEVLIHPTFSRDMKSDNIVIHSGAKEKIGYNGDIVNLTFDQKLKNDLAYSHLLQPLSEFSFEFYRNRDFFKQLLSGEININRPQIDFGTNSESTIVICPGAKTVFRRWAAKNFAQLTELLRSQFPTEEFIICCSEKEKSIAKEIIENAAHRFTNYSGKLNLIQLAKKLSKAKLVITNDSGPFHIAMALGKKVVCIANGENYGKFVPYPKQMNMGSVVLYPDTVMAFSEAERLEKFNKAPSPDTDINEIKAEHVYEVIKKMFEI